MAVLIVLLASWLILRGVGALGVDALRTWQHSAVYALAVMFVFTGTAHFNKMKHDLARMIPAVFPKPMLLIYVTGVLEFLGALGLLLPQFRRLAGICLALMLIGLFVHFCQGCLLAEPGQCERNIDNTPLFAYLLIEIPKSRG